MKAIKVKYLGPTTMKGTRLKASTCDGQSLIRHRSYELNWDEDAHSVAVALCKKMNWPTELIGGTLDNDTYVFVFKPREA